MWEVADEQDVARLTSQSAANPGGRVVWLQVARGRELSQRVACAPEAFGRLACAQLPAVPDDRRPRTAARGFGGRTLDRFTSAWRQRPPRIDLGPDGLAMMDEEQLHLTASCAPADADTLARRR